MRPDRSGDARLRFLEAAEAMLCTSGMAGTGIKDVAARGGAPIGSLYHYFPGGKAQLVAEAVELNAARVVPLIEKLFAEDRDPARCVRQFFDTVADGFERAGRGKGCAIGAVALDVTPDDDGIRTVCHEAFGSWTSAIAARLAGPDDRTRQSFAEAIVVGLEGAFVLARASRSSDPFREAGRWLSVAAETLTSSAEQRRARTARGTGAHGI